MAITAETPLEARILADPEWQAGAAWHEDHHGHPEDTIADHIEEVLANVDRYAQEDQRADLRLIALVHDTFKGRVRRWLPRVGPNDHGRLARRFAERYVDDPRVLDVIELHDEAYRAWKKRDADRARRLIDRLGPALPLFRTFYRCDNETGSKAPDDRVWFESIASP